MSGFVETMFAGSGVQAGRAPAASPTLPWVLAASDALIALCYLSVPIVLAIVALRRKDMAFGGLLWIVALFILAFGATHVGVLWAQRAGDAGLETAMRALTAFGSVVAAILLWRLIPRALSVPSSRQLQAANAAYATLVEERDAAVARLTDEIAQRRQAEEALVRREKMDAVGQLTGGIAHDFNNLLQAIGGNLELVRQNPDSRERVARWASNALKGVDRGVRLTGQLLAFSRTQRLTPTTIDLPMLIEEVAPLVRRSIGAGIELRLAIDEAAGTAYADRTQLELAIVNLALNARDAMPQGGTLTIASGRQAVGAGDPELAPGDYSEVVVTDTGWGMSAEVAARAVEPFFTTKGVGQATGLGLSTAFGMARQSGGALKLVSAPGRGTTATILLPTGAGPSEAECARDQGLRVSRSAAHPRAELEVMLIDDDDDVRETIVDTLGALGHACASFSSGPAALRALEQSRPDLIVLDFAMPDMNGADVARRARALKPGLPIIFVTGHADSAMLDDVLDANSAILRKPFRAADLARLIDRRHAA